MIGRHQHRIMLQNVRSAAKTALRNRQTLLRIIHQTANNKANHFSTLASATSTDFKYTTKIDRFNPYLPNLSDYNTVRKSFRWNIPAKYNIGVDICDKHAVTHPDSLAIIYEDATGKVAQFSFGDLKDYSDRLANAFVAKCGMRIGDRVAILLPQSPETAIAHIATYKMGGIALPLFTLFGPDAVQYRLNNSEAKTLVTSEDCLEKILKIKDDLPHLKNIVLVIDSTTSSKTPLPTIPDINIYNFWDLLENASPHFTPVDSNADDPALIIYTSGTTGNPKGCLHAHRVLPGHLPGVEFPHNFFPQNGDCFWTPADWAWIGGLIDVLLPSLLHGVPVLAHRATKFDPEHAFYLMAKHNVRNVFMPPTALKMMRQVENPHLRHNYRLRSIGSGGESLGEEILEWGKKTFNGLNINEFYGQTEANLLLGNCSAIMPVKPGSMGVAIPGREIEVVNEDGDVLPNGTVGTVAVRRGDPVMFLKYWNNPEATEKKFTKNGEWMMTGDLARKDETGYFYFVGRSDDIIKSSGYRIGPAEIEDCLLKHPTVLSSAAVGSPDPVRGEIVKAFIVLRDEHRKRTESDPRAKEALAQEIQAFVKQRLAAYEYPREIEFVDELPMTTTGKIMRNVLKQREIEKKQSKSKHPQQQKQQQQQQQQQ